jgi:quinoprotein dehydrogenase-associated probable ABC transporter substrate-binding protein
MSLPFRKTAALLITILLAACSTKAPVAMVTPPHKRTALRVCADPNNLPFSNNKGEGFENKLAEMIAKDLGLKVEYTWWAQRRGFFRNTLKAGSCDVVMGVPSGFEMALTTAPYYRSTYVFVTRERRHLNLQSIDDPRLHELRIGVQLVGDDFSNIPPAHALSRRGIIQNVKGYTLYGNYSQPNPPAQIIEAVAKNKIDVGVAWGPMAGYFAKHSSVPLTINPVMPQIDRPFLPFVFDISMAVRRDDQALKDDLERVLQSRRGDINKLLDDYGVPRVEIERDGMYVGN